MQPTCSADVLVFIVCIFAVIVLVAHVRHRYARQRQLARKWFLWVWAWIAASSQTFNNYYYLLLLLYIIIIIIILGLENLLLHAHRHQKAAKQACWKL